MDYLSLLCVASTRVVPTSPSLSKRVPAGLRFGRWLAFAPLVVVVGDVVTDAPGVRHDGEGGVGARSSREWPAVHHEQVVYLVSLAPLVEHGSVGVVSHTGGAVLVGAVAGHSLNIHLVDLPGVCSL